MLDALLNAWNAASKELLLGTFGCCCTSTIKSISRFGALLGDRHTCIHICFLEYYSILTFLMLCNKYVLRLLFKMSGGKNLELFISFYKLNNLQYIINVVSQVDIKLVIDSQIRDAARYEQRARVVAVAVGRATEARSCAVVTHSAGLGQTLTC